MTWNQSTNELQFRLQDHLAVSFKSNTVSLIKIILLRKDTTFLFNPKLKACSYDLFS